MKNTKTSLKNNGNSLVTKSYLKSELRKFDQRLVKMENRIEAKLEEKLEEKFTKFEEKINDKIMTKLDDISGQLETMRQENSLGAHHTRELRVDVDDHEKRLLALEKQKANGD